MALALLTRRGRVSARSAATPILSRVEWPEFSAVEEVKVSRLLVDHLARARGGALDREIAVSGAADDVLRGGIVRVEIELAVPIGEEIDGLADPHWLGVVAAAGRLGDLHVREVGQLQHPDPRGGAAPIVLPLAKPLPQRRVRQELSVRRDRAHVAGGNRQAARERLPRCPR